MTRADSPRLARVRMGASPMSNWPAARTPRPPPTSGRLTLERWDALGEDEEGELKGVHARAP